MTEAIGDAIKVVSRRIKAFMVSCKECCRRPERGRVSETAVEAGSAKERAAGRWKRRRALSFTPSLASNLAGAGDERQVDEDDAEEKE